MERNLRGEGKRIDVSKYGALFALLVSLLGPAPGAGSDISQQELPTQTLARSKEELQNLERVSSAALPTRLAFVSAQRLWILDARDPEAQPVPLTEPGVTQIVGWSNDGQWLAFLHEPPDDPQQGARLYVVRPDVPQPVQVDARPVLNSPAWSPVENRILYLTAGGVNEQREARLATVQDDGSFDSHFLFAGEAVVELAWAPDGQSIAVSEARTDTEPLRIRRLKLDGTWSDLLVGEPPRQTDEIYNREAAGLTWSPDGQYLAYFAVPNSLSLAADGVAIQVLDVATGKTTELGKGLAYPAWFAWSFDSRHLAFIRGSGREATRNKQLQLFHPANGTVTDASRDGYVDTAPVAMDHSGAFLFVRGTERAWGDDGHTVAVYVPGQRIWQQSADGSQSVVTAGTADTADYEPHLSPDGTQLFFLRLSAIDQGSLYLKRLDGGAELELVRGLQISPGYYGNYLPRWVAPYWSEEGSET